MLFVLVFACLLLAWTDVFFTKRIISSFGESAELNGLVRLCTRKFGVTKGLYLAIGGPTVLSLILAYLISPKNPSVIIGFLTGMRFMLFLTQLKLHALASKLKMIQKNF